RRILGIRAGDRDAGGRRPPRIVPPVVQRLLFRAQPGAARKPAPALLHEETARDWGRRGTLTLRPPNETLRRCLTTESPKAAGRRSGHPARKYGKASRSAISGWERISACPS